MTLDAQEFYRRSSVALEHIDTVLGDAEFDALDLQLAGDVLTLSFRDGTRFIINAHSAARQIWMAAGTTAWHFDFDAETGRWVAHRTGDELLQTVAQVVGQKLGVAVSL